MRRQSNNFMHHYHLLAHSTVCSRYYVVISQGRSHHICRVRISSSRDGQQGQRCITDDHKREQGRGGPSPGIWTRSRVMAARSLTPVRAIAVCSSSFRRFSMCSTPACPPRARPQTMGRPTNTALAPRASAFSASEPRLIPPSNSTGTRPSAPATT